MSIDDWSLASWLVKVMLYLATAISIGGVFSYYLLQPISLQQTTIKYMIVGALMGVFASIMGFLLQVGSFANVGLLGMFDPTLFQLLLSTTLGHMQVLRAACFILLSALFILLYYKQKSRSSYLFHAGVVGLLLLLVYSYAHMGHVANQTLFAQCLISLHVTTVSLWMGALFPLWQLSRTIDGASLQKHIYRFSRLANYIVGILTVCGLIVAYLLLNSLHTLTTTAYGQGFMLKLGLFGLLLLLAAINKCYLTPRLQQPKYATQLSYAILLEIMLGLAILLVTGFITSVIGLAS